MGLAYSAAGPTGLIVLKAAVFTTVFFVVWTGLSGAGPFVRSLVVVGLVFGTIHMTSSIRPQIWTGLAVACLCRILIRDRPRERWWLPALFAVWVNCHGGWIVGLGILGVWAGGDVVQRPFRWRGWALILAATLVATLLNPYGPGLWRFLAETVRMSRDIAEWGPLWGTPVLNWIPWIVATIGIAWVVRRPSPHRWSVAGVLLMLSYSSLRVMRIESLFIISAAILLAPAIRERWPRRATPLSSIVESHQGWFALAIVAALAWGGLRTDFRPLTCIGVWSAQRPDQAVAPSLRHAEPGRLVTFFDWGQYAIWHFGPRLRVSMDGRRETVYTDRRLAEHGDILAGTQAGLDVLADWRAEYVWLPERSRVTADWLRQNGYRMDVRTARSFVAVREDLPVLPEAATDATAPLPSCFPG
jgi:hypothetical protein